MDAHQARNFRQKGNREAPALTNTTLLSATPNYRHRVLLTLLARP